jgi:hypothetical protein
MAGEVESVPFIKSGAYPETDPNVSLYKAWFDDPLVRPPVGTYRIDAVADYGFPGCAPTTPLTASITVQVVADPGASVPPPVPADTPPEAVLVASLDALVTGDCAGARAFATDTFVVGNGELCGRLTVHAASIEPLPPARPSADEAVLSATLIVSGGDGSIPEATRSGSTT